MKFRHALMLSLLLPVLAACGPKPSTDTTPTSDAPAATAPADTAAPPADTAAAPADASMEILPSRTLQTLERSIRQRPVGTEWLLSGEIVVAGDRNYLLLTRAVEPPRVRFESP